MTKYFIRARWPYDTVELEQYLMAKKAKYVLVSNEFGRAGLTALYSVTMDRQEAVALKLSIPIIGMVEQPIQ